MARLQDAPQEQFGVGWGHLSHRSQQCCQLEALSVGLLAAHGAFMDAGLVCEMEASSSQMTEGLSIALSNRLWDQLTALVSNVHSLVCPVSILVAISRVIPSARIFHSVRSFCCPLSSAWLHFSVIQAWSLLGAVVCKDFQRAGRGDFQHSISRVWMLVGSSCFLLHLQAQLELSLEETSVVS